MQPSSKLNSLEMNHEQNDHYTLQKPSQADWQTCQLKPLVNSIQQVTEIVCCGIYAVPQGPERVVL